MISISYASPPDDGGGALFHTRTRCTRYQLKVHPIPEMIMEAWEIESLSDEEVYELAKGAYQSKEI